MFANYATFIETPIPLDVNVRAGSKDVQTDKNFNVEHDQCARGLFDRSRASAPAQSISGADATPIDPGLKPQSVGEYSMGLEYEVARDLAIGVRGIYRHMRNVIEDGSFDDGNNYFIFNPGTK